MISVMALALAAFVAVAGIGYVSPGAATRIEATGAASAGFRTFGGALTAYPALEPGSAFPRRLARRTRALPGRRDAEGTQRVRLVLRT
ncbi:hypothetical protein F8B43_5674 [Methylorubrum populi]|uniref:Uncharacterized protein n=1 Tax=Methylorubrum populi TaxID=223967 RepID=A0A833J1F9_9HYPH|nr:hypothetical protein F8B43_5674 [Methylorubrum populi]